jgi:AraC-like DNA-binding protein
MIAAWATDPVARERLAAAVRDSGTRRVRAPAILWCATGDELFAAVADGGATAAIVEFGDLDLGADCGESGVERVARALREEYPVVPVLVYAPLTAAASRAMIALGRAGVVNTIIAGHDDLRHALEPILAEAASVCVAEAAYAKLSAVASSDVAGILNYAVRRGSTAPTVADAARVLRVNRKTLAAWCQSSGAPSPRVLVTWCRLIIAAERLIEHRWSAERVARALGFSSGSTLTGLLKRHTGLTRPVLRERGSGIVVEMLVQKLADGRGRAAGAARGGRAPAPTVAEPPWSPHPLT